MSNTQPKVQKDLGYIRFFHTYPTDKLFTLYLDDKPFRKEWGYEDFTPYIKCTAGQHLLCIKQLGSDTPYYEKRINVKANSAFTHVWAEHPKKESVLHLFALEDTKKIINGPHSCIRLGHFSKPITKTKLQSGADHLFFKNIAYAGLSHYMPIEPNTYPLELFQIEDDTPLALCKAHKFKVGRLYTFYLIGNGSTHYPYKLIPTIDGPSFLTFKKPSSAI